MTTSVGRVGPAAEHGRPISEVARAGVELEQQIDLAREQAKAKGEPNPHPGKKIYIISRELGFNFRTYERVRTVGRVAFDEAQPPEERARAKRALAEMDLTGLVRPVVQRWRSGDDFRPVAPDDRPPVIAVEKSESEPSLAATVAVPPATQGPRKRRSLPDAYRDAVVDLHQAVTRLERLGRDDRFPDHSARLAAAWTPDMNRAAGQLAVVINNLLRSLPQPTQERTA